MPARVAASLALVALVLASPTRAEAGRSDQQSGTCTSVIDGVAVVVECRVPGGGAAAGRPSGVVSTVRACSWVVVTVSEYFGSGPIVLADPASGFEYFAHADGAVGRRFADGVEQKGFRRTCPGGGGGGFSWVTTSVTVRDLIDDAVARARRSAPAPVFDMSPSPQAGGIVNLGVWLAVQDVQPAPVRVEAGTLWAEASLQLVSTSWSTGTGEVVDCAGAGTPIVDLAAVEQGPCGFTYTRSSPDDDPYDLAVTATWQVSYRSSSGSGPAGTITRTATVAYDVDEVQTVGIAG